MASSQLTRTPSSASNRKTWTWSGWIKRANIGLGGGGNQVLFEGRDGSGFVEKLQITQDDLFEYDHDIAGQDYTVNTVAKFRDTGGWYHIVWVKDTTQSTESDRVKLYVNGTQISLSESQLGYPPQNYDGLINTTGVHYIGANAGSEYYDGQMTHINFVDGTALTPTSFGETDATTGIWKPKTSPSVTYGTNGYFLKFDNSANMGLDSGGGSNSYATSGTVLQYKDTPSNNMQQLNVNDKYAAAISNSGRTITNENNAGTGVMSTLAVNSGKWYWEAKVKDTASDTFNVGIRKTGLDNYNVNYWPYSANGWVYAVDGNIYHSGSSILNTGTTAAVGDIISFILDLDAGTLKLKKNGSDIYSGNAVISSLNTGDYYHIVQGASQAAVDFNFGDGYFGTTAITSAGSNGNGLLFEYDVP